MPGPFLYFLSNNGINAEMSVDINESIHTLQKKEVNCVILDMGIPAAKSYEALDELKKNATLANIPIIHFYRQKPFAPRRAAYPAIRRFDRDKNRSLLPAYFR